MLELGCGTGRLTFPLAAAGLEPIERRGGWRGESMDGGARRYVFVCGGG